MAIRKIVKLGDDALRKVCKKQEKFDLRLNVLLHDMADTMYKAEGVGLVELVNPEIIERSEEIQCGREGCLSLPGRQGVVTRPMRVKVRAQDRRGVPFEMEAEGFFARAVCHELDHLDGTLYIDVMDRELSEEEIEGHIPEDDVDDRADDVEGEEDDKR